MTTRATSEISASPPTHWQLFLSAASVLGLLHAALLGYLFLEPHAIEAYAFEPDANPDLTGPYVPNDELTRARLISMRLREAGARDLVRYQGIAPESLARGPDGWLYTGLCDAVLGGRPGEPAHCRFEGETMGWVVRFDPRVPDRIERYVPTGGRPLGLAFDDWGRLYIADAMRGLLRVESNRAGAKAGTPAGEAAHVAVQVATCNRDEERPDPFPDYADSVTIGPDGTVWFTCPSQRYGLSDVRKEGLESRPTGRVVRYEPCDAPDPRRCPKQIAADGLMFANGIAHLRTENALLVAEWGRYRITRLALDANSQVTGRSVFFDNTPGYPDNISVGDDGTIWVGLVIRRNPVVDRLRPHPFLENALARLPDSLIHFTRHAFVIGLDGSSGKLKHNLQDTSGLFNQATGAYPFGNALYVTTNTEPALACIDRPANLDVTAATNTDPGFDPCLAGIRRRANDAAETGAGATPALEPATP
jgi:sugar lactone lactonase YvrE